MGGPGDPPVPSGDPPDGTERTLAMEAAVRKSEREENAEVARQAAAVLPSLEMLDKIMRYENPTIEIFHHAKTAHSPALPVPLSAPRASRVTLYG